MVFVSGHLVLLFDNRDEKPIDKNAEISRTFNRL